MAETTRTRKRKRTNNVVSLRPGLAVAGPQQPANEELVAELERWLGEWLKLARAGHLRAVAVVAVTAAGLHTNGWKGDCSLYDLVAAIELLKHRLMRETE